MALKETIDRLIRQAKASGQVARTRLPKGLTVAVRMAGDNLVDLQLSRADVYPSAREWKTVLAQWPGLVVTVIEPRQVLHQGVYYLRGRVKQMPVFSEAWDELHKTRPV
jgi:hypothetical protein